MASSRELLFAAANGVELTFVGSIPALPPHVGPPPRGRLRWAAPWREGVARPRVGDGAVAPLMGTTVQAFQPGAGLVPCADGLGPAVLFEAVFYEVYLETEPDDGAVLETDAPGLLSLMREFRAAGGRRLAHYRLEVGNDVGILGLSLRRPPPRDEARPAAGGSPAATEIARLEVEVFPRKLDYQEDYRAMLSAVSAISSALVFEAAGRTRLAAGLEMAPARTASEWYEIMRALAGGFLAAIDAVGRDPARRLGPRRRLVGADRARKVAAADLARALRAPGNVRQVAGEPGALLPLRIVERSSVPDFDAEGNRHVRRLLARVLVRLRQLEDALARLRSSWGDGPARMALVQRWGEEIGLLRPQLQRRLAYEWIAAAGEPRAPQPSPTVEAHPAYARVFEHGRALLRGLHVDAARIADVSSRPVSLLYEQWCFLAIVDALRRHGGLERCSEVVVRYDDARVTLGRGREAAVEFRLRATGRPLKVYYNRQYDTRTVAQRPDASVHIESGGKIHVFDAKYRVEFDREYEKAYGGVGPKVEDVSTMHRYRDAIVEDAGGGHYRRRVASACVLFPWRDADAYAKHAFKRSLDEVGIGGLPFLPGCTGMVAGRLDAIVAASVGRRSA